MIQEQQPVLLQSVLFKEPITCGPGEQISIQFQLQWDLSHSEEYASKFPDLYIGCVECKESHHKSAFCPRCNKCLFRLIPMGRIEDRNFGSIFHCTCGNRDMWE